MFETDTYKKYKNKPQDNFPEFIIVHHSGGTDANSLADTSNQTAKIIEDWHLSKGWEGIGYHYIIVKDGSTWRGRPEQFHGAHTVNYNQKSIGICVVGNFDATLPTKEQETSLAGLLRDIMARYNIPAYKIVPHRKFAQKTCYGNKLSDTWAGDLASAPIDKPSEPSNSLESFLAELQLLINKYKS
jgi:N-acetyl-anhydromuramyl-L-alanine amidase AmpD